MRALGTERNRGGEEGGDEALRARSGHSPPHARLHGNHVRGLAGRGWLSFPLSFPWYLFLGRVGCLLGQALAGRGQNLSIDRHCTVGGREMD